MAFVSIEWLKRWYEIPAGLTAAQLAKDLVKVSLEEETIHTSEVTGPLVCGGVLRMEPRTASNGEAVNYCRVDVGAEFSNAPGAGREPSDMASRSIICKAHNFRESNHVVVSLPGTALPGDFRVATRKTYGHVSDDMICSTRGLGLGEDYNGIVVLEEYLGERGVEVPPVGTDLLGMLGLNHELLEINITPDQSYCFSIRGVGCEYSRSTGAAFTDWDLAENLKNPLAEANNSGFSMEITDDAPIRDNVGCGHFVTRMMRGFNPKAKTPEWMVTHLESAGTCSISLTVDATNYVMLDLGQPMHAYSLDKIKDLVVVRRARDSEKHTTLDEVERSLYPEDLLIIDCRGGHTARVLGIAGVTGGAETGITAATTNVLLEAAHSDTVSVARAVRRYKIPSESSRQFERGTDPRLPPMAAQYTAELLMECGGGIVDERITDVNHSAPVPSVTLGFDTTNRLIGVECSAERCEGLLKAIGCQTCRDDSAKAFTVTPPSWRPDLVRAARLMEEIARLDGFDQIPSLVPVGSAAIRLPTILCTRREINDTLAEAGLTGVTTHPFLGDEYGRQGSPVDGPRHATVRLTNPLADGTPALRTSVPDTLLNTAPRNVARDSRRVTIYKLDQVALAHGVVLAAIPGVEHRPNNKEMQALRAGMSKQPWHIAAVLAGNATETYPGQPACAWDWASAIALAMRVATSQGLTVRSETPSMKCGGNDGKTAQSVAPFHPGRVAQIRVGAKADGGILGYTGELHPQVCHEFGLPERSCAFEIDLDAIEKVRPKDTFQLRAVSTFPVAKEDFAFIVDTNVAALKVQGAIVKAAGDAMESVHLFDSFTGRQLRQGKKSLASALQLYAVDHTLNPQDTREIRQRVIAKVQKTCRATLQA